MSSVCSICRINEPKYKCPACGTRTCLLQCVTRHKRQAECSGTVDETKFVPQKELDAGKINRDYNFLLNFGRTIELGKADVKTAAKNMFKRPGPQNHPGKRPKFNQNIDPRTKAVAAAYPHDPPTAVKRQNTLIVQLPAGMSRSSGNKTGYDKKLGSFTWTVEWRLLDAEGVQQTSFVSYRLKEHLLLQDAVPMNILKNAFPDKEIAKEDLHFYLDNVVSTHKARKSLLRLSSDEKLSDALRNKIVVEYPTIYIGLDAAVLEEFVSSVEAAYQLEAESSESETSDSSTDDSSDSESESDSEPEETSSKPPLKVKFDENEEEESGSKEEGKEGEEKGEEERGNEEKEQNGKEGEEKEDKRNEDDDVSKGVAANHKEEPSTNIVEEPTDGNLLK